MLLVTGCIRSGTTILQSVLNHHPDVGVTNELHSLLCLGQTLRPAHLRVLVRRGCRLRNRDHLYLPQARGSSYPGNVWHTARLVLRLARSWGRPITPELLRAAYRTVYPRARIVGDKSPAYVFDLERYLAIGVSCIVIYRDCRDVTASAMHAARTIWKGMPHAVQCDTAAKAARLWVRAIDMMERHAGRVRVMRYEELTADPERELALLAQWLRIDPAGLPAGLVHRASVGRHKVDLSAADLAMVLAIAGPTMARLGYRAAASDARSSGR